MKLIYLASPYSHEDPDVRKWRFCRAVDAAAELMHDGYLVFSPIAHSHMIATRHDLPGDFAYWAEFDRRMVAACDEVWVLKIDGWAESVGVKAEIELAKGLDKPVFYMEDR